MSRSATVSVLGMYNWDNSLFANFSVPTGMDKDVAINEILLECAELELLYPDWDVLKFAIGNWTTKEKPIWEKLYATVTAQYDPLYNKDAYFTETSTETRNLSNAKTGTDGVSGSSSVSKTGTEGTSSSSTASGSSSSQTDVDNTGTDSVAAYNSSSFENRSQHVDDNTASTSASDSSQASESQTITYNTIDAGTDSSTTTYNTTDAETGTISHSSTRREYGNIGVTTSQQMLQAERDIAVFSVYNTITDSFKTRFCLEVY